MSDLLIASHWILFYNPPNESKLITFLQNSSVGDGRNKNEHRWQMKNGKLELLEGKSRVFSRFDFNRDTERFVNTKDPDTLWPKDQYIQLQDKG